MTVSVKTYEQVALEDSDEQWELICGRLRAKPPMTFAHNAIPRLLTDMFREWSEWSEYVTAENSARLRVSTGSFLVPDLCVIPRQLWRRHIREQAEELEIYAEPLPLVVEVWS